MIIRWPKNFPAPPQVKAGAVNSDVISLIDVTATTLRIAGLPRPPLMHGRIFLGEDADAPRTYAFAARDRIDETVQRIRSVHDSRYHYLRTFTDGPTFASLNRYKEKCFPIIPLMRELHAQGKLTGPPATLMQMRGPSEELYDTQADRDEIHNLVDSKKTEDREALLRLRAALDTWMTETSDRGAIPEPAEVLAPFTKEMHDWFGTPAWHRAGDMKK
jgi:arylsulfatase A-like enzyme